MVEVYSSFGYSVRVLEVGVTSTYSRVVLLNTPCVAAALHAICVPFPMAPLMDTRDASEERRRESRGDLGNVRFKVFSSRAAT